MKKIITVTFLHIFLHYSIIFLSLSAQTLTGLSANPDSLLIVLKNTKPDTTRVKVLLALASFYSESNFEKAIEYAEQAMFLSKEIKYQRGEILTLLQISRANSRTGKPQSALSNIEQAIGMLKEFNDSSMLAQAYSNLGIVYYNLSEYNKALENHLVSMKIHELMGDLPMLSGDMNNAGNVFTALNELSKAKEYYLKSLELAQKTGNKIIVPKLFNNIGILSAQMGQVDTALALFRDALEAAKEMQHIEIISRSYTNLGNVYLEKKQYDLALENFQQALQLSLQVGDKIGEAGNTLNLATVYTAQENYRKALELYHKAEITANEIGEKGILMQIYTGLADAYSRIKNPDKTIKYFRLLSDLKDTLFREQTSKQIAEMQTKYESSKKEKEIEIQKLELEKSAGELKGRNITIAVIAIVAVILLGFMGMIYKGNRQLQRANGIVSERSQVINSQREQLSRTYEELSRKSQAITDNIISAQRFQSAILPNDEVIKAVFPDSFIFYQPRDMVSGDLYWFSHSGDVSVIAALDCTGHGVQGALMAMMTNSLLNQIVHDKKVIDPARVLELLDKKIKSSLDHDDANEGVDIALCAFHTGSMELYFAGANRPLLLVREGELKEYKQKNTVGVVYKHKRHYTFDKIQLKKGDTLYLFTDGITDQFGGEQGKKYMLHRFKSFVMSIQQYSLAEQNRILERNYLDWKGQREQIDDICVIGVRV